MNKPFEPFWARNTFRDDAYVMHRSLMSLLLGRVQVHHVIVPNDPQDRSILEHTDRHQRRKRYSNNGDVFCALIYGVPEWPIKMTKRMEFEKGTDL